jgi:hypothetical protein
MVIRGRRLGGPHRLQLKARCARDGRLLGGYVPVSIRSRKQSQTTPAVFRACCCERVRGGGVGLTEGMSGWA